jgi:hypothetical protein
MKSDNSESFTFHCIGPFGAGTAEGGNYGNGGPFSLKADNGAYQLG